MLAAMVGYAPLKFVLAALGRSALRKAIMAVCAGTFLFIGIAHNLQHFETVGEALAWQNIAGPYGEPGDEDGPASPVMEQCHGCSMFAVPLQPGWVPRRLSIDAVALPKANGVIAHRAATENPPPIS